jgi:TatD DNase family protein
MIIDTHAHYNLEPFYPDWQRYWQEAKAHGVTHSIVVGTDVVTSQRALEITTQDPNLFAALGIHPTEWNTLSVELDSQLAQIEQLLKQPKVIAIGETGLDYFHFESETNREEVIKHQQQAFRRHIQLAQKYQKILIIHVRDQQEVAYWDTLRILEEEQFTGKFILHCVSGPLNYIQKAMKMGAYFGVAGNVTYKSADPIRKIVESVPLDRLVSETDCPFLPPVPYRGKTCEPWMIAQTVSYLETQLAKPAAKIHQNAISLLDPVGS